MPGWNRFPVRDWFEERFAVPVAVENDANCMAVGEHSVRPVEHRQSIMVKVGSGIGAGVIVDGRLYRGATGGAGEITHVRVEAAQDTPCSCGNTGCLETVASGAALVRILRERGLPVAGTEDVVRLALDADPEATRAVRQAGRYLGQVLAANVNFFNPDAVYLGGILSTLEPSVAAVRSQLYEGCHPLVTQHLVIERTSLGADAGLAGAGQLRFHRGEQIDHAIHRGWLAYHAPNEPFLNVVEIQWHIVVEEHGRQSSLACEGSDYFRNRERFVGEAIGQQVPHEPQGPARVR
jgi:predicted NBD/HSP70 family sugar kinase